MRHTALALAFSGVLGLSACAALPNPFARREPPAAPAPPPADGAGQQGGAAPAAPPPAEPGAAETLDPATTPEARRPGFFSNLGRALGNNSNVPNVGPCPAVRVLYDASRFVELFGSERFENVGFTGEIRGIESQCRYVGTDPIEIEMDVNMAFGRGPRAEGQSRDVVYWVAVTRKDIAPIARERYTYRATFPAGVSRIAATMPRISVSIPRANKDISGANFEVFVGFELTDAQLQFNRDGKRFRVDSGPPR